jgi:arsenate reductase-like glutaredoxin family protein
MEANEIAVKEVVSASKKLQADTAKAIAKESSKIIVAKGKSLRTFKGGASYDKDVIEAMLGTTGNLRAPLLRIGKTTLVGFNEDAYTDVLL